MHVSGIELTQDNPEEVWSVKVDPEDEDEGEVPDRDYMIHQLYLKMVRQHLTEGRGKMPPLISVVPLTIPLTSALPLQLLTFCP